MDTATRAAWGPRIKAARVAAGLSQYELAEQANTNRRTVSDFERGKSTAQTDIVERLIAVLSLAEAPLWDRDVQILGPAIMTLIQHIPPRNRTQAVALVVDKLVTLIKGGTDDDILVVDGEPID